MASVKCLVKECPNTQEGDTFEGPICSPCAAALRGENSNPSASRIRDGLRISSALQFLHSGLPLAEGRQHSYLGQCVEE